MTAPAEAVLLVGGRGTRLRPLTIATPKPLLPTGGVPFLAHVLAGARAAGIERVVLATSYRAEEFRGAFDGRLAGLDGLELVHVDEREPLGTGGAIRNAAQQLRSGPGDPVVVLNGDVLSGHDLLAQLAAHAAAEADVTLHLTQVEDPRAYGCVPTDGSGRVTAFLEKTPEPVTDRVNAGCYVFRREVIDRIPPGRPVSVERETFPELLAEGRRLLGHLDQAYWLDVGTPAAYVRGACDLVLGRLPSAALPGPPGDRLVLAGADVAADATVDGGSTVGAGATVGPAARVTGSVLFDGARVGTGAVVRDSVLAAGAQVGSGCVLDGVVVGDRARVGAGNELRHGARVWVDATVPANTLRFSSDEASA
jgi:mannose-1-phosphate guanylyltransferase